MQGEGKERWWGTHAPQPGCHWQRLHGVACMAQAAYTAGAHLDGGLHHGARLEAQGGGGVAPRHAHRLARRQRLPALLRAAAGQVCVSRAAQGRSLWGVGTAPAGGTRAIEGGAAAIAIPAATGARHPCGHSHTTPPGARRARHPPPARTGWYSSMLLMTVMRISSRRADLTTCTLLERAGAGGQQHHARAHLAAPATQLSLPAGTGQTPPPAGLIHCAWLPALPPPHPHSASGGVARPQAPQAPTFSLVAASVM